MCDAGIIVQQFITKCQGIPLIEVWLKDVYAILDNYFNYILPLVHVEVP